MIAGGKKFIRIMLYLMSLAAAFCIVFFVVLVNFERLHFQRYDRDSLIGRLYRVSAYNEKAIQEKIPLAEVIDDQQFFWGTGNWRQREEVWPGGRLVILDSGRIESLYVSYELRIYFWVSDDKVVKACALINRFTDNALLVAATDLDLLDFSEFDRGKLLIAPGFAATEGK